ncbi:hypothetical protein ACFRQM_50815 [Streptomyces sp. NPDC056831]|uniref:hypothetical protein n=1 Tax=Streptomyces sp. NPDC056831 TaxID=3345954 RepID=UPI0036805FC6
MDDQTKLRIRHAFDRLAQDGAVTDLDRSLMEAFERLMHGVPEITDGTVTVVNICTEAGVSRASYYRSPVAAAVKEILEAPEIRRPEPDELRAEVARLRKLERALRSQHAGELRELRDAVTIYANQIQVLALAKAELEEDNRRLRQELETGAGRVVALPPSS